MDAVEEYIAGFPPDVQDRLRQVQAAIAEVLPDDAEQTISYRMPTFRVRGHNVVHFAGYAGHVGFYPLLELEPDMEARVAPYRAGRGTARFRHDQPLPVGLVQDLTRVLLARQKS